MFTGLERRGQGEGESLKIGSVFMKSERFRVRRELEDD